MVEKNRCEKVYICIAYYPLISTDFIIFLNPCCLLFLAGNVGGNIRCFAGRRWLRLGGYLIFGVQPGTQIHQLTPTGTERKEFCIFRLFEWWYFSDFAADWTSVLHNGMLTLILICFLLWYKPLFQLSGIFNTISGPRCGFEAGLGYRFTGGLAGAISSLLEALECIIDFS